MGLYVSETYINKTAGHMIGESDPYETWCKDRGDLYRAMQKEYGRCTGKCYVDRAGKSVPIGWVFVGRDKYTDCNEFYLRETWVTVYKGKPERIPTHWIGEMGL